MANVTNLLHNYESKVIYYRLITKYSPNYFLIGRYYELVIAFSALGKPLAKLLTYDKSIVIIVEITEYNWERRELVLKIINNKNVIYSFKPEMNFSDRVKPGETFKIMTNDCFLGQIKSEDQDYYDIDNSKINPATGPIFVEGATPGDLLKIKILGIDIYSEGVAVIAPNEGVLGNKVDKPLIRIIPIVNNCYKFGDLLIPIKPMIGVIGVAPSHKHGEYPTDIPWKHGGNMDTNDIRENSTIYLPVRQNGGLLAVGDCHAVMGDGEVGVSGCEIGAEITLEVDLIKNKEITWPLVETGNETMVVASGDTLEESVYNAVDEATKHLQRGLAISWGDAYILSSLAVDLRISQVVNQKKTVRAVIPKSLIETDLIINSL